MEQIIEKRDGETKKVPKKKTYKSDGFQCVDLLFLY